MDHTISLATGDRARSLAFYRDGLGLEAFGRATAAVIAGGTSVSEPSQQEWNAFAAKVADPDGHLWMILVAPDDWTA